MSTGSVKPPSPRSGPRARPRVGVIHATPLSIRPLAGAFAAEFPEAIVRNVLDDSLLEELRAAGELTPVLIERMERVLDHLLVDEIDAVQFACSGYVPVVDAAAARLPIPVRKPDEAMYRDLAASGHTHIGIVATVQPALDLAAGQLRALVDADRTTVVTRCVPEAMDAAQRGDDAELARSLGAAVDRLVADGAEVVALAQYSMSPVMDEIAQKSGVPVYSGPVAAAKDLRQALRA